MRIKQSRYNKLLEAFNCRNKIFTECVDYLIGKGFSRNQVNNAVHVYRKGGEIEATLRMSREQRNELLDNFGAMWKTPRECVDFMRSEGCTYRQANSAVYKYRQEKGLIGT